MQLIYYLPIFGFFLFGTVLAVPAAGSFVRHEKRESTPSHWVKRSNAPLHARLPLRISLKQRNAHLGHDHLMDISDPMSQNFGKYWTSEQIEEFFSPHATTVDSVLSWLQSSGIDSKRLSVTRGRGSVTFHATVPEAETLFNTKYHLYEHAETGDLSLSCDEYSIHHSVSDHIEFVTPTIGFPAPRSRAHTQRPDPESAAESVIVSRDLRQRSSSGKSSGDLANCEKSVTPDCIRALYHVPMPHSAQPGNELGVFEEGNYYDQKDLDLFFSRYTNIPNGTHPVLNSINGAIGSVTNISEAGLEVLLDLELAYPLIYPQQIRLLEVLDQAQIENITYGQSSFDSFLDALDASFCTYEGGDNKTVDPIYPDPRPGGYKGTEMCGTYKPPNVISVSYSFSEAFFTPFYIQRQCNEYMKLGLQGTSVLFATGDVGAVSKVGVKGCLDGNRFNPSYPASCPYITAVGATQIKPGCSSQDPEIAALNATANYTSGGGFSNVFPRPAYQDSTVTTYLKNHATPHGPSSGLYNPSGRGFPDVSAIGLKIATYTEGIFSPSAGTSAATPIFASLINLINENRLAAGKGPVGFLNPTLYQNPSIFNDITEGFNWDCKSQIAFKAAPGWDPVTGLGTPNYPKLLDVFMKLP